MAEIERWTIYPTETAAMSEIVSLRERVEQLEKWLDEERDTSRCLAQTAANAIDRAERAEALIAKARDFVLDYDARLSLRDRGWWLYRLSPHGTFSPEGQYFPTLDTALAAYEQSREKTHG